ncbi:MAG: right-handed parallel beta-helix repeat-containing protein [Thermoplasmatota archaeon]
MIESRLFRIPMIMTAVLIVLSAGSEISLGGGDEGTRSDPPMLFPHDPIEISGDSDLPDETMHGSGTVNDPYVIRHLSINATGSVGISISNVTEHLLIYQCLIYGGFFFKFTGFLVQNSSNVEIRGCAVYYSMMGVEVIDSEKITVSGCFVGASRNGINLTGNECIIKNTTVKYNSMYGFTIVGGGGNRIENCLADGNTGVLGDSGGIRIIDSNDNIIDRSVCSVNYGDGIGIMSSVNGETPPSGNLVIDCESNFNVYGIFLGETGRNDVVNCTFRSNNVGVYTFHSRNSRVVDSLIEKNEYGVKIVLGGEMAMTNSSIIENDDGVRIISSSGNTFTGNNISGNGRMGIMLTVEDNYGGTSSDNLFWENIIDGNGPDQRQVIDNGKRTSWDDGSSGNYWGDHQSPDEDGDGVVDIPREIDGDDPRSDRFPLVGDFPDEDDDSGIVEEEDRERENKGSSVWGSVLIMVVILILLELAYLVVVKYGYINKK